MTLSPREQRLARSILLRLVTPERTRAIVELRGLSDGDDAAAQVVARLADARLLQIESGDEREGSTVELVHESLIDRWTRLREWLDETEHDAQFLARLRVAAQQWRASGRAPGLLWREHAAQDARAWLARRDAEHDRVALAGDEQQYLAAVVDRFDRALRRRRRRVIGVISVLTAIAFVVSYLAMRAEQAADRAREESARAAAQAVRADAEARQARNATRMAAARELQARDPTTALALLRELELPELPREWADLALQALAGGLHELSLTHPARVHTAALSPDERRIVTASEDGVVRVWDGDGRGEPRLLRGHADQVNAAAWSPDGRRIVSAASDQTVRVWDVDGDGEPLVLRGHTARVHAASFSPDGRRVVSAAADGTLRIWRADDGLAAAIAPDAHALILARLLLALATLLLARLAFWHPLKAFGRLEIGIMVLGYLAIAAQLIIDALPPPDSVGWVGTVSVHVFTFGAMGLVIPAMMIRIANGHTGRKVIFGYAHHTHTKCS